MSYLVVLGLINVYKDAFLSFIQNRQCENNGYLEHLYTKMENQSVGHKIIANFVFRFTYF